MSVEMHESAQSGPRHPKYLGKTTASVMSFKPKFLSENKLKLLGNAQVIWVM